MNPTLLLAIATLALVVGPLLERISRRLPVLASLIDGATVGGIVIVSCLHLLPEAGAHLGWWALALFVVGLALPLVAEKLLLRTTETWRLSVGFLVLALFLAHEVIESAALASKAYDERVGIATLLVVVGHRLPLGVLLWGHTKRRFGLAASIAVLALVAAFTWFGPMLLPIGEGEFSGVLSALLAGGLLHLVLQHGPALPAGSARARASNAWAAVGALVAAGVLVPFLTRPLGGPAHQHDVSHLPERLYELVLETSLPLLLGVLGAAAIEAFVPVFAVRWLSRGSRFRQAFVGAIVGAPIPVCSCGVLPIYRSLIVRGVAPAAAISLLIAAPEIGVDSILLSWRMLGGATTLARLASALVLALAVGWLVGRLAERLPPRAVEGETRERPDLPPLSAMRRGLFETWAHLSPWILFGLLATALVEPWISTDWAQRIAPWMQILVLSLAGLPTYICAAAATPFAALLLAKGFAPGAVIAFLLTGPASNFTTIGALRRLHSKGVAVAFVVAALGVTFLIGMLVDSLLGSTQIAAFHPEAHEHGIVDVVSAVLLGALTLWVLCLEGPRSFLRQLTPEAGAHDHDHDEHATHAAHSEPTPAA